MSKMNKTDNSYLETKLVSSSDYWTHKNRVKDLISVSGSMISHINESPFQIYVLQTTNDLPSLRSLLDSKTISNWNGFVRHVGLSNTFTFKTLTIALSLEVSVISKKKENEMISDPSTFKQTATKRTLLRCSKGFRKSFNSIAMINNEHNWNSRNLTNTTLQVLITSSNNVTTILKMKQKDYSYRSDTIYNTIISVGSFVSTSETLEPRVLC